MRAGEPQIPQVVSKIDLDPVGSESCEQARVLPKQKQQTRKSTRGNAPGTCRCSIEVQNRDQRNNRRLQRRRIARQSKELHNARRQRCKCPARGSTEERFLDCGPAKPTGPPLGMTNWCRPASLAPETRP